MRALAVKASFKAHLVDAGDHTVYYLASEWPIDASSILDLEFGSSFDDFPSPDI